MLIYGSLLLINESRKKSFDDCYTWMFKMSLNINWKQHKTNKEVYGNQARESVKIQERKIRLGGHIDRPELVANRLILME